MPLTLISVDVRANPGAEFGFGQQRPELETFEFFIDDDRYSVPTLRLVLSVDEAEARRTAAALMDENEHYRGLEAWLDGERLWGLGSFSEADSRAKSPRR